MCSAISDYYNIKRGIVRNDDTPITNEDLRALLQEMRDERIRGERQNRYLLEIIRRQSKPQFWREVGANLTADAFFGVALRLGKKIFNV